MQGESPPKVLAMAWQPKSLNSLGHPKYRDQFLTSVFRTTLPSSSHLLPCTILRHPRHANLSLCHPLRTSFPYFIPSGPSIVLGSTLSLTMRTSEPLAPSHPAIVKFPWMALIDLDHLPVSFSPRDTHYYASSIPASSNTFPIRPPLSDSHRSRLSIRLKYRSGNSFGRWAWNVTCKMRYTTAVSMQPSDISNASYDSHY